MVYTACEVISGEAHVADEDEFDPVTWVTLAEIPEYAPYGLFGPVQSYLDTALTRRSPPRTPRPLTGAR